MRCGWLVCTAMLWIEQAGAQDMSGLDAGSLLRQSEQGKDTPLRELPVRPLADTPPPPLPPAGADAVVLRAVRFTGDTALLPERERAAIAAREIGQSIDFAGMTALADRVTRALKRRGWLLARAYLPEQDLTAGELTIAILAGHLDGAGQAYRVQPVQGARLRIKNERLSRIVGAHVPPERAVTEAALTRAVLLMNDLPGVTARAALEPGAEPGSSRIVIGAAQAGVWHPGVSLNTMGSESTGRLQVAASLGLDDPFGSGDRWNAAIVRSKGLSVQSLAYSAPLGYRGVQFSAGHSWLDYRAVAGDANVAGLNGSASTSRVGLGYPLIRSVRANVRVEAGYAHETARDAIRAGAFNRKRSDTVTIALSGDFADEFGGGGRTLWSLRPSWGRLHADLIATRGPTDRAFDSYRTAGQFSKASFQIARLQQLTGRATLFANVQGQVAGKNLDSAHKFFPGGPAAVRAYASGEAVADSGIVTQLELRYTPDFGADWGRVQFSAFHDNAWVRLHHNAMGLPIDTVSGANSYHIAGAGLSAALSLKTGGYLRATWAAPIGRNPGRSPLAVKAGSNTDGGRLWLEAGIQF